MADDFHAFESSLTSPAANAADIIPSDAVPLPFATRAIYVGTTGNIRLQFVTGDVVTMTNVQAGAFYPVRVALVFATGTTASGMIGLR